MRRPGAGRLAGAVSDGVVVPMDGMGGYCYDVCLEFVLCKAPSTGFRSKPLPSTRTTIIWFGMVSDTLVSLAFNCSIVTAWPSIVDLSLRGGH